MVVFVLPTPIRLASITPMEVRGREASNEVLELLGCRLKHTGQIIFHGINREARARDVARDVDVTGEGLR